MNTVKYPLFNFEAHNGQTLTENDLKKKLVIAAFFSIDDPQSEFLATQINKLHEQFDDRNEVLFLLHTLNPENDSIDRLQVFAQTAGLTDEEQCYLLTGTQQSIYKHLSSGFKWPEDYGKTDRSTPYQLRPIIG